MACEEGQFDVAELMVNDQFKTFSINLNVQHVNGMTPFDLALSTVLRYSRVVLNDLEPFLPLPVLTYMTIILIKKLT